ncbi:MAG: Fic family protein, partial [Bacteroidota bacterium]
KHLYKHPITDAQAVRELTDLSSPSVYQLLRDLENQKIVEEMTGAKRGKIFYFREYVDIFSRED